MDPRYEATRLIDVVRSMKLAARSAERERWPREQLARFQQERLEALVRHARRALALLPRADRRRAGRARRAARAGQATLMEHFDDIVTDRRLRRDELLAHLERIERRRAPLSAATGR